MYIIYIKEKMMQQSNELQHDIYIIIFLIFVSQYRLTLISVQCRLTLISIQLTSFFKNNF